MEIQTGAQQKASPPKDAISKNVEIVIPSVPAAAPPSLEPIKTTPSAMSKSVHTAGAYTRQSSSRLLASSLHGGRVSNHGTTAVPSNASTPVASSLSSAKRIYRTAGDKWVTRDIAALDFMLGIPLQAEGDIVHTGWLLQQQKFNESEDNLGVPSSSDAKEEYKRQEEETLEPPVPSSSKGRWWEKWLNAGELAAQGQKIAAEEAELERPDVSEKAAVSTPDNNRGVVVPAYAPGRRLEGDEAVRIQIPLTTDTVTKQRSIARLAALREWELQTAHGLNSKNPPLLDGRVFFSAAGSYPASVFSLLRYEPKKEEAALRRQKLEKRGGGGTQFIQLQTRDWRGISYRALLPRRVEKKDPFFNRFVSSDDIEQESDGSRGQGDDNVSQASNSSDESDEYVPGLLDDPDMVQGRHRTVMIGDRVTGPIVSSTIQFVKPALLKADLNKQFRERFDGWEPPPSQIKFIGARVVDGVYTLMDPGEEYDERPSRGRGRQGSVTSISSVSEGPKEKIIRMPPSLTLSKIRSLKHQSLLAAVQARLEVSTVALASVYFERLCLDCRVDKSNRRLCFAACLLLATKLNEPNVGLVMQQGDSSGEDNMAARLKALARPNKRSSSMFAVLLEFFTQDWSLSLKHLFDAEWGVFSALGFSLHASPSQVTFHFKRLMRTLEWNPLEYLGSEMYGQWQDALSDEEERRQERERRRELARLRKEERLLSLHLELENKVLRRNNEKDDQSIVTSGKDDESSKQTPEKVKKPPSIKGRMKLLSSLSSLPRFGRPIRRTSSQSQIHENFHSITEPHERSNIQGRQHRRSNSGSRLLESLRSVDETQPRGASRLPTSPSMPLLHTIPVSAGIVAIDIPELAGDGSDASSIGSIEPGGLYV